MKNLAFLSLVSLLVSCVAAEAPKVEIGGFNRNAPMMWNGGFPKEIRISEDFTEDQRQVIADMALAWNDSVSNKMTFYRVGSTLPKTSTSQSYTTQNDMDETFGIYLLNNMPKETSGQTIAVTLLKLKTQNYGKPNEYNQIFYTDIYVNNRDYEFRNSTVRGVSYNDFDLNTVMVHELGHALGLGHKVSGTNSIMIPAINESAGMKEPTNIDVSDISYKYGIPQTGISGGAAAMAIQRPNYVPDNKEDTPFVKYIIELRKDGECIHSVNGKVVERHKR